VINVVTDSNDLGDVLTTHPEVAKVSFTGSTATGYKVMANAAKTLKRTTLDLGGNDAGIVLDDADPARIAAGVLQGAFLNSGQACIALKRLYVHDSLYEEVCAELAKLADAAVVGDGLG
jgi:acyl-CoA reductase-like NAD-dependent aldehyde dehydrogenase